VAVVRPRRRCDQARIRRRAGGAEGEGISLSGPVRTSSGIAQVLLLE